MTQPTDSKSRNPSDTPSLRRRRAISAAGGLALAPAALASSPLAAPAVAQERRAWSLVTSWPKGAPGPGTTAARIAETITALSGGRLTVTLYGAGELVPALEVFDAVAGGVAQMAHTASLFWQGKLKAAPFFTAVPFGLTPDGHTAWLEQGGGQALWDALYAPAGIKPFQAGNSGMQMGGWFKREIASAEDLKGLKMRIPGLGGQVMRRLGVTAVAMPPGEILPALQSGAIDAAEFLGPWSDRALGFDKAAPYYYWPGFHEPNGAAECLVSLSAYQDLPEDLQALVSTVCAAENQRGLAEADWQNAVTLEAMQAEGRIALRRYPDDLLVAAGKASREVLAELAAADEMAGKILPSYDTARRLWLGWGRVARHAVLDAQIRS